MKSKKWSYFISFVYISVDAVLKHFLHQHWMRFITDFENINLVDVAKSIEGGLQIIQSLSHITLSSENNSLEAFLGVGNLKIQKHLLKINLKFFITAIEYK